MELKVYFATLASAKGNVSLPYTVASVIIVATVTVSATVIFGTSRCFALCIGKYFARVKTTITVTLVCDQQRGIVNR